MLQNYYKIVNFRNNWVLEVSRQARYLGRRARPIRVWASCELRAASCGPYIRARASCELGPYAREASCKMLGGHHLTRGQEFDRRVANT